MFVRRMQNLPKILCIAFGRRYLIETPIH